MLSSEELLTYTGTNPRPDNFDQFWEKSLAELEITTWFKKRDPRHLCEQEVFTTLGYLDLQHLAPRVQAEVTLYVGPRGRDLPPSTQYAAYKKLTGSKQLRFYPDFGHDDLPGTMDEIFQTLSQKL